MAKTTAKSETYQVKGEELLKVGTLIAPILAAVGAIAALVTECSITVERK